MTWNTYNKVIFYRQHRDETCSDRVLTDTVYGTLTYIQTYKHTLSTASVGSCLSNVCLLLPQHHLCPWYQGPSRRVTSWLPGVVLSPREQCLPSPSPAVVSVSSPVHHQTPSVSPPSVGRRRSELEPAAYSRELQHAALRYHRHTLQAYTAGCTGGLTYQYQHDAHW